MDYYKVLGVDKKASQEEIKKAFRKKAHEFHPDKKNGNAAKFKEANEAYQVLGNAEKRKQYDTFGSAGPQGMPGGGFNWSNAQQGAGGFSGNVDFGDLGDIFGDMFGFGRSSSRRASRGQDIQVEVEVSFDEAYFGTEKTIRLYINKECQTCAGSGAEPGSKIEQCSVCNGSGKVRRVQNTMLGAMQVETTCTNCDGRGETFSQPCQKCSGSGITKQHQEFPFKVPAGIDNGQTIRFSGKGESLGRGGQAGDLYIIFRVKRDSRFQRQGANIETEVEASFGVLAAGGTISVPTPEGKVRLKVPAGTKSGKVFILKDKGFANIHGRGRGDELVKVNVIVPTKLTKRQKELIDELEQELGDRKRKNWF